MDEKITINEQKVTSNEQRAKRNEQRATRKKFVLSENIGLFIYKIQIFTTNIYSSYFSKMALVGFQYELVSLNVNEVCFEEEQ